MVFRLNLLVITTVLALFATFAAILAHNSYNTELQMLVADLEADVQSASQLQLAYYQQDKKSLKQFLVSNRANPAILFAASYDNQGQMLASSDDGNQPGSAAASLEMIRGTSADAETSLQALDSNKQASGLSLWSAMLGDSSLIHLSVPVFTALNPTLNNLTAMDFAMATNRAENSLTVIGYVQYILSPMALLASAREQIGPFMAAMASLALLVSIITVLITRKIAIPLNRLTNLAEKVIAGKPLSNTDIGDSPEFADISRLLELTLGGVDRFKQEASIDAKLAVLTAEERAAQLSKLNKELSQAETVISETKSRLRKMTYYDSLTALPNRRLLTEQLTLLLKLSERNKHSLGLLLINLDNFKRFNEALGRSTGDQLLKKISERLSSCLRDSDLLAQSKKPAKHNIDVSRLGGDEFTIVLSQLERPEAAEVVAERITQALKKPFRIDEHELVITASIGIALAPGNAQDVEELLHAARIAMLHAQNSSAHTISVYTDKMAAGEPSQVILGADLIKAIDQKKLTLLYQPQVNTVDGVVVGADAILSWEHPEHGLIAEHDIISTAEEIGYIGELGDWVLGEVCQQMKAFIVSGVKLPKVCIKVPSAQLDGAFPQRLKAILANSGLPAEKLELAVSESALINRHNDSGETIAALQASGVRLSIADFGISGVSLDYLSQFSLNAIRLDSSFVKNCDTHPESARLIIAMLAMAKSLEFEVLSAGVENESQCQCLVASGARIQQGSFFSKPVSVRELKPLLVPWHFMEKVQHIAAE